MDSIIRLALQLIFIQNRDQESMLEAHEKSLISALQRFKNEDATIDDLQIISKAFASGEIEIIPKGGTKNVRQFGGANFGESNEIRISGSVIGTQIITDITSKQVKEILDSRPNSSDKSEINAEPMELEDGEDNVTNKTTPSLLEYLLIATLITIIIYLIYYYLFT